MENEKKAHKALLNAAKKALIILDVEKDLLGYGHETVRLLSEAINAVEKLSNQ